VAQPVDGVVVVEGQHAEQREAERHRVAIGQHGEADQEGVLEHPQQRRDEPGEPPCVGPVRARGDEQHRDDRGGGQGAERQRVLGQRGAEPEQRRARERQRRLAERDATAGAADQGRQRAVVAVDLLGGHRATDRSNRPAML
jgi:hypothetical protein